MNRRVEAGSVCWQNHNLIVGWDEEKNVIYRIFNFDHVEQMYLFTSWSLFIMVCERESILSS